MNPIKEYIDIGIFLAILVAIGAFAHHERMVEKEHLQAAQYAADLKEAQHVAQVNANAKASVDSLQAQLSSALANHPKPAVVVRMCNQPAAAGGGSAANSSAGPALDAAGGSSGGVGGHDSGLTDPNDIAPRTEEILARDKALINYLQGYVRTCQAANLCAK